MVDHYHEVLDLRGAPNYWALLKARTVYKKMPSDGCLEIVVDDMETKNDVLLVLSGALCEVFQDAEANSSPPGFRIHAKKSGQP